MRTPTFKHMKYATVSTAAPETVLTQRIIRSYGSAKRAFQKPITLPPEINLPYQLGIATMLTSILSTHGHPRECSHRSGRTAAVLYFLRQIWTTYCWPHTLFKILTYEIMVPRISSAIRAGIHGLLQPYSWSRGC
jgi:hypothetical protein